MLSAIKGMKNNKSRGCCNITTELIKAGGEMCVGSLHQLFVGASEQELIPDDWRKGIIIPIYKGKGCWTECGSNRGIHVTLDLSVRVRFLPVSYWITYRNCYMGREGLSRAGLHEEDLQRIGY